MFDKIKVHIKKHQVAYSFGAGVVFAMAMIVVVKRVDTRYLAGTTRTALLAKKVTVKDQGVLLIQTYSRHTGPPSWMVRHVESGTTFLSQAAAAKEMGISRGMLGTHLNGGVDNVAGQHFVRVAMAIPRSQQ